ncbi:MAG: hypothetical protein AAGK14_08265 [Verrucomicrobiota bacterium]
MGTTTLSAAAHLAGLCLLVAGLAALAGCTSFREYNENRLAEDGVHGPGMNRTADSGPQLEAFRVNQSF